MSCRSTSLVAAGLVLLAAGSGGDRVARYGDVKPCLSRVGIVGAAGSKGNVVYKAAFAFRGSRGGSGEANLPKAQRLSLDDRVLPNPVVWAHTRRT